jgi:hypothetical protein
MTKQEFYELCIKKTFDIAQYDNNSPFYNVVKNFDISLDDSLDMINIKLASAGVDVNIPEKEQFSVLGSKYICQILAFVMQNIDDIDLREGLVAFMKSNPSVVDLSKDDIDVLVYSMIFDTLVGQGYDAADFGKKLIDFYLTSKKTGKYVSHVAHIAYALGKTDLPLEKIHKIVNDNPLTINRKTKMYGKR